MSASGPSSSSGAIESSWLASLAPPAAVGAGSNEAPSTGWRPGAGVQRR
eukprot:CAMPEP_0171126838 /NCGR_PEP_ID=MMETSP0766_2-20121228/114093_1 /TAXON_ID=439317 /ORGANISM="Gambierdiscus australes, Strain CAWD 149" /LENGTH=48 /DNA_ID= /DNA_START= /DNA_END= /DNA_ORIENTATION=